MLRLRRTAPLKMSVSQVARLVDGQIFGDAQRSIHGVATLQQAQFHHLAVLKDHSYRPLLGVSQAGVLMLPKDEVYSGEATVIRCDNPARAISIVLDAMYLEVAKEFGISVLSSVHPSAVVAEMAWLGPFVTVGANARIEAGARLEAGVRVAADAVIGADTHIHENAVIGAGVTVGARCIIHPGTVLGADGFGFVSDADGHHKLEQIGTVVIESDVEIGANCCVDRAALGETRIGQGSKLDNLVHIAHGVQVGRGALMAAYAAVAGSTVLGAGAVLGGRAAVLGHLHVGAGAQIAAMSMVTADLKPGVKVSGVPAFELADWRRSSAVFKRLPQLRNQLRAPALGLGIGDELSTTLSRLPSVLRQLWPNHQAQEITSTDVPQQKVNIKVVAVGAVVLLDVLIGESQHQLKLMS